jgi:hypothetical protein
MSRSGGEAPLNVTEAVPVIAYHVDLKGSLMPNMPIHLRTPWLTPENMPFWNELFPDGVSVFGFSLLESHNLNSEQVFISQAINEFNFEYVRRNKYPEMPSRFQSFFTCKSIEDAKKWASILNLSLLKPQNQSKEASIVVWKVEVPDDSIELDITWRDILYVDNGLTSFNFFDTYKNACRYWSGIRHPNSKSPLEIISRLHHLESRVQILEQIVS